MKQVIPMPNRDGMLWLVVGLFAAGVLVTHFVGDVSTGVILLYGSSVTWVCYARANSAEIEWPFSVKPEARVLTYVFAPVAMLLASLTWLAMWFVMGCVVAVCTVWALAGESSDSFDGFREYGAVTREGASYVLMPLVMLAGGAYTLLG